MFRDVMSATVQHFFSVIFPRKATPKVDVIVPILTAIFNKFFKIVIVFNFKESAKFFVFIIIGKYARFVKRVE